jgi:hypothetical protein
MKREQKKRQESSTKYHDTQMQALKKRTTAPLASRKVFDKKIAEARKELLTKLMGLEKSEEYEPREELSVQPPVHEP